MLQYICTNIWQNIMLYNLCYVKLYTKQIKGAVQDSLYLPLYQIFIRLVPFSPASPHISSYIRAFCPAI